MRRSIASIAILGLLAIAAGPAFAGGPAMPCCRGGAAMVCCLPGPGCAMKACPASAPAVDLPGLPPATAGAAPEWPALPEAGAALANVPSPRALPLSPPELPPRG